MRRRAALTVLLAAAVLGSAGPALADHTNPNTIAPVLPQPSVGAIEAGEGDFEFLANLGPMQGTDLEFFSKDGVQYVSAGTLGQGASPFPEQTPGFVGQRIVQLTDEEGQVLTEPEIVADHYSAACALELTTSATGLQHDVQAVPLVETELLIDTTDAVGRCHDEPGGGIEIIDVTGLGTEGFEPREIALMRFNGQSHTVTADVKRPGILYNNPAEFGSTTADAGDGSEVPALSFIDVIDARSCLGLAGKTLDEKRALCKPEVYRIDYKNAVSSKVLPDGRLDEPSACHDITSAGDRLYCGGLNASFVVDVSGMFTPDGDVMGDPLPCTEVAGTRTAAPVIDCALRPAGSSGTNPDAGPAIEAFEAVGSPAAEGWRIVTTVNHVGRNCSPVPPNTSRSLVCNTNTVVPSDEGVAVSHENDPANVGDFMFVTDERGGGVIPPGATCSPGLDNPIGNGGMHVFDISDPENPTYAMTAEGEKAVFISTSPTPSPTFCTIHVIEQIPGEQRVIAAYYDGGTKIVDYFIDGDGNWSFKETAAYRLPGANTWASEVFKVQDNGDGTNTYFFVSTSFALVEGTARGIDVFSWTGPANPIGAQAPGTLPTDTGGGTDGGDGGGDGGGTDGGTGGTGGSTPNTAARSLPATGADVALLLMAATLLPLAFGVRMLRRRISPQG